MKAFAVTTKCITKLDSQTLTLHNLSNLRRYTWHIFVLVVTIKNIYRNIDKTFLILLTSWCFPFELTWFFWSTLTGFGGVLCYLGNTLHAVSLTVCFGSWGLPESNVSQVWNKNISLEVLPWNGVCLFLKYYDGKSILQIQWMFCV